MVGIAKLCVGKFTKTSKTLQQNNSEILRNEHDKEILKIRYVSSEKRQIIIADLRLINIII